MLFIYLSIAHNIPLIKLQNNINTTKYTTAKWGSSLTRYLYLSRSVSNNNKHRRWPILLSYSISHSVIDHKGYFILLSIENNETTIQRHLLSLWKTTSPAKCNIFACFLCIRYCEPCRVRNKVDHTSVNMSFYLFSKVLTYFS